MSWEQLLCGSSSSDQKGRCFKDPAAASAVANNLLDSSGDHMLGLYPRTKASDGRLKIRLPRRKLPSSPGVSASNIAEHGSESDTGEVIVLNK